VRSTGGGALHGRARAEELLQHPLLRAQPSESESGEDLVAVLREALANVARHARAGNVVVELVSRSEQLRLAVEDDGVGFSPGTRSSGLTNMRRRAERHREAFDVALREPTGTTVPRT
jgi:signal transduction histidine kinase